MRRVLVTGAGGFIGHHLAGHLATRGEWVRGVDLVPPAFEPTRAHEFQVLDLRRRDACLEATRDVDEVYALAANMGGIGYIHTAAAGAYDGGREKSPAAICRKVALARDGDAIDVWGDGRQRRSYCYVDDCVAGLRRLIRSDWAEPLNIGQERTVTVDELVDLVATIAGKRIGKGHDPTRPQGVRARASDNRRVRQVLSWEPRIALEDGLTRTYAWIAARLGGMAAA